MPIPKDPSHRPPSYESFGDARPSVGELRQMLHYESQSERLIPFVILRSEVCLDLAVLEPRRGGEWIKKSRKALKRVPVLRRGALRKEGAARRYGVETAHLEAAAELKLAELPNWRRAVKNESLENNYEQLLEAAHNALPLMGSRGDGPTRAQLVKFIPILLGARGVESAPSSGWLGRLALRREGNRSETPDAQFNPNWDVGIAADEDPAAFISPAIRLSLRSGYRARNQFPSSGQTDPEAHRKAGIIPVSAAEFGFHNPLQIILSCVDEYEDVPSEVLDDASLLSSDQLDEMTLELRRAILPPLAAKKPKT